MTNMQIINGKVHTPSGLVIGRMHRIGAPIARERQRQQTSAPAWASLLHGRMEWIAAIVAIIALFIIGGSVAP